MTHIRHTEDTTRWKHIRQECLADVDERGGISDMTPMIEGYRDGEMIAMVQPLQINRDDALSALPLLVGGLALDAVVLCLDSHYTTSPTNPTTGKPWGPGEMQKACDEDGLCSTQIITDCLMVIEQHRDGYHRQVALPYHEDKDAKQVHWHDTESIFDSEDSEGNVQGRIVDALNHAFGLQPMTLEFIRREDPVMYDAFVGLSDFAKRIHLDCVVAKELLATGRYGAMLNGTNEEGTEIIRQSFSRGGFDMETLGA